MKRRTEKWMSWTLAIVLLTQVAMVVAWFALQPRHGDLFKDGTLTLITEPTPGTRLRYAHASIRGKSLNVHGRIIVESGAGTFEQDGFLRVVIESPDKGELGRVTVDYHLSAKLPKGGGGFSVELPFVPPDGSVMKISWQPAPGSVTRNDDFFRSRTWMIMLADGQHLHSAGQICPVVPFESEGSNNAIHEPTTVLWHANCQRLLVTCSGRNGFALGHCGA